MLYIFSQYTQLTKCYTDVTDLEVSQVENLLIFHIHPTGDTDCNQLPSAIIVKIFFQNKDLDVQLVDINFNYSSTSQFAISVPDISLYFNIKASHMKIKSYNQIFEQQIQEITLTRNKDASIFHNLSVTYDQIIFTATVYFPMTFSTIIITNASLAITNSFTTYRVIFDGNPLLDTAIQQLTISFKNSGLSTILYDTGILNIRLECEYGTLGVNSMGFADTQFLIYKDQPSSGDILTFTPYSESIYIKIKESSFFRQELAKASQVKIVVTINQEVCQLVGKLPAAALLQSIQVNNKLQANFDHKIFQNLAPPALSFQECMLILLKDGQYADMSFVFYDSSGVPIDRLSMVTTSIHQSCFDNIQMILQDNNIQLTAKWICPPKPKQKVKMMLRLYSSQHTYFLEQSEDVMSVEFYLDGNIEVYFRQITKDMIQRIKSAYSFRLLILTTEKGFVDTLQPYFITTTFQVIITSNIIILSSSVSLICALGGINIFYKKKAKLSKQIKQTMEMDDI